ncbi:hypothetical protein Ahy_B10g105409 [Arachis hypogaea]|uniref:SWIM-type domain-containing protein n=1 Tax=Arachis hypogaea TaxID=3818 RepID=A0A444X802_ARAHY|nr:hypothetical protein Ahy_B10g105409 [Arachis hypogaea]
MDDRVRLKVYYHGHILLQTSEGVKFVCDNLLDIIIPFTLSFEELKGVICEKMDSQIFRRVSCILYRYPISVFGGFVQFQTKYMTDEASMQEMFSVYLESRSRISFIELYIEFEQSERTEILNWKITTVIVKKSSKVVDPGVDEDQADEAMVADVADVANALANQQPFVEPSFMRSLDLEAMHALEFPQYVNAAELPLMPDGEFTVGMEFSSREAVIKAMKDYTIRRGYSRTLVTSKLHANQRAAGNIQVSWFDRQNEVFEVRECPSGVEYAVDLRQQRCDCGEFQVDRLPCRHVFACCANQRLEWQLYVHDVYKMDQVRRVYRARFRPLGNPTTWPVYHGPRFVGNPFLRRGSKGRPRMTRFLNEMDTRMLRGPRRCKQCGAEGHSRSRFRQRGGPSNPESLPPEVPEEVSCRGLILLETYEGVQFVCENSLDVVIPFTLSLDELKGVICEKIHSERCRRISCILYRYPLPVFGGFVHFQTKYVTDEASMQEIFSTYMENCHRISCIKLYIEFEQSQADRTIELKDFDSDNEEDFESNYEIVGPGEDEEGADGTMNADVAEVANALANSVPFQEPSFMQSLDLEAMNAPEFSQYMNAELLVVADGEFTVGMEFSSREEVIKAMKDYTIRRGVDYRVYESELTTFYVKCTQYGKGCDWLIRVTKMQMKSRISQDHLKLDSKTVAEAIKPLVEVDPSLKDIRG